MLNILQLAQILLSLGIVIAAIKKNYQLAFVLVVLLVLSFMMR